MTGPWLGMHSDDSEAVATGAAGAADIQIEPDTVLQVAAIVEEKAQELGAALLTHSSALRIEPPAEDIVSVNAMQAWNTAVVDNEDSHYARMHAYLRGLHTLAQQLRAAAKHYQLNEDETAATFKDRRVI